MLIGTDPATFLDNEPDLAGQVLEWADVRRRTDRFKARHRAEPFVRVLEARHNDVWRLQARRLLGASEHIAAGHPKVCRLAAILVTGRLASAYDIANLDDPPAMTRAQIQSTLLGDSDARRTSHNEQALIICDTCTLMYPLPPSGEPVAGRCNRCGGDLLDGQERASIPTPAQRLHSIESRLRQVEVQCGRSTVR